MLVSFYRYIRRILYIMLSLIYLREFRYFESISVYKIGNNKEQNKNKSNVITYVSTQLYNFI